MNCTFALTLNSAWNKQKMSDYTTKRKCVFCCSQFCFTNVYLGTVWYKIVVKVEGVEWEQLHLLITVKVIYQAIIQLECPLQWFWIQISVGKSTAYFNIHIAFLSVSYRNIAQGKPPCSNGKSIPILDASTYDVSGNLKFLVDNKWYAFSLHLMAIWPQRPLFHSNG